jgi:UDP-glucose 4-epimerase
MRILLLGAAGGIARQLAARLLELGHEVWGIDARPFHNPPAGLQLHQVDLRKRAAEEVFRRARPEAVVHMATVTALSLQGEERHRINLGGTQAVFAHSAQYGVKQLLFVGRHTFYGAAADSALYHTEDEPPRALDSFPELADLVAADLYAATALWRLPQITTAVLRLCYTLGAPGSGTLSSFLSPPRVPRVLGFDPLFQFMHERDVVLALEKALEKRVRGIFNVAGPQPLPLSLIIREAGRSALALPETLLRLVLGRGSLPRLPAGALDHLKYPVVADDRAFRQATGYAPAHDELHTLRLFREAPRKS